MQLDYEIIGARIQHYRKKHRMTQAQLAECVGLSDVYIRYIEKAQRTATLDTFVSIVNALGCSMDDLLIGFQTSEHSQASMPSDITHLLEDCSEDELRMLKGLIEYMKSALRRHD